MRVDVPTCDRPAARCTDSIRVAIATDADDHAANLTGWSRPMTIGAGPVPRHFARILHRVAHAGLRGGDQPRCAAKLPGVERRVFGLAFRPGTATVIKPAPFLPAKRREHRLLLESSSGWYDLAITTADQNDLCRFAGHVETGRPSTSDPAVYSDA
jgi:hypothetical protein